MYSSKCGFAWAGILTFVSLTTPYTWTSFPCTTPVLVLVGNSSVHSVCQFQLFKTPLGISYCYCITCIAHLHAIQLRPEFVCPLSLYSLVESIPALIDAKNEPFLLSNYWNKQFFILKTCGLNCPGAERQGAKKIVCFPHKIFVFHFFSLLFLCSWFFMSKTL
jgi:hypothetical protein